MIRVISDFLAYPQQVLSHWIEHWISVVSEGLDGSHHVATHVSHVRGAARTPQISGAPLKFVGYSSDSGESDATERSDRPVSISAEIQRTTLIITPGQLLSGTLRVPYREGDDESLLRSYLVFVREMRGQRHARSVTLRSADIATIADHLDTSDDLVLGKLLDLMGVTRAQRKLLLAMLAAGALTIVATGSIPVAAISDIGTVDLQPLVERSAPEVDAPRVEPLVSSDSSTVTLEVEAPPVPATSAALSGPDSAREFDVAIGRAIDGSTVAVIAPPLPPSDNDIAIGTADDGSTVAVIAPPLPPSDAAFGVDDEGFDVGVGSALPPPVDPAG